MIGVRTRSFSLVVDGSKLSSWPDCSESLLGVPIIGERVVGLDIRLFDRETFVEDEPAATMPRSIIEETVPLPAPALESLRPGEMELRLLPDGMISKLDVMLFLRGIFDGELLALLTTCNNPFS